MADTFVQVAPDGAGKKIATAEYSDGENTLEIQKTAEAAADGSLLAATPGNFNADAAYALLVRQIGEDNAYTQELLERISSILLSVFGRVKVANSLRVSGTFVGSTFDFTNNLTAISGSSVTSVTTNMPWQVTSLPVSLNANFPLSIIPQHIYGGISV